MRSLLLLNQRDQFLNSFDRLFDEMVARQFPAFSKEIGVSFFEKQNYPKVDVIDAGSEAIIEAELPGLTKDEIKIKINDDILTISGEKRKTTEDNLKKELDQVKLELVEIQKQLTEKRGQLEANREAITKIDTQIQEVNQQLEAQKNEFFNTLLVNIRQYLPYIIGFIISFIIYLIIKRLNQKYSPPVIVTGKQIGRAHV